MRSIREIKDSYQGEWLAIVVEREGPRGPEEGQLVCHSRDRDDVWRSIKSDERRIYVTFSGPMLEEGYAVAF